MVHKFHIKENQNIETTVEQGVQSSDINRNITWLYFSSTSALDIGISTRDLYGEGHEHYILNKYGERALIILSI